MKNDISQSLGPDLVNINVYEEVVNNFEILKIAACFLWLSLPAHYRVTDEALLAETT